LNLTLLMLCAMVKYPWGVREAVIIPVSCSPRMVEEGDGGRAWPWSRSSLCEVRFHCLRREII